MYKGSETGKTGDFESLGTTRIPFKCGYTYKSTFKPKSVVYTGYSVFSLFNFDFFLKNPASTDTCLASPVPASMLDLYGFLMPYKVLKHGSS